jgi:hypothetical protein
MNAIQGFPGTANVQGDEPDYLMVARTTGKYADDRPANAAV